MEDKTKEIAELNDLFRMGVNIALGLQFVTRGIRDLSIMDQAHIFQKVLTFSDFSEDNDPHGERDSGAFGHNGQRIFWKIDYYDATMTAESEDPSDPFQTRRVLTIMLASEY